VPRLHQRVAPDARSSLPEERRQLRPDRAMKITDILQETSVVGTLVGRSKADVIEELAGVLARDHGEIDRQRLIQALEDRERLNSTALGDGVAIPHGKLPGLALAGFLPQLHPDRVQVLGNSEVSYLGTLGPERAFHAAAAVAAAGVACFVVTNGAAAPAPLVQAADAADVPVLATARRT